MPINKTYEAELNLKDLLFHILYKWWFILLLGLIGAGVFGFIEYWGFEKYHRSGELSPAEVQYETDVAANQKALENAENTLSIFVSKTGGSEHKTSILMKIDPTNIWTAEKKYYVDVERTSSASDSGMVSEDRSKKILAVLSEAFSEPDDESKLIEVFGTDDVTGIGEVAFICLDKELNTLTVIGCGTSKEEAILRKEYADSYLLAANEELQKTEKYTLLVLGDYVSIKTTLAGKDAGGAREERDLAKIQNDLSTNYQNYINRINSYTQSRDYYLNRTITKPEPKIKDRAVFGFVVGALTAVVICLLWYLLNGKLKTGRELKNRYGVDLVGDFTHSRALWKGKGIDWILEKLEFGKKQTDFENELDSIASLIDEAKDGKTILLTGTLEENRMKRVYDGLSARLQEKGIELAMEADYLHNNEAVAACQKMDSVLLVEEKYQSKVHDLNRMAEMLTIEDAAVIGAVLL